VTIQTIKDLLASTRPFKVRMVSGRIVEVPHPDFAMLSRTGTSLILCTEDDRLEILGLSQIESIDA